jgi:hypothetical protein
LVIIKYVNCCACNIGVCIKRTMFLQRNFGVTKSKKPRSFVIEKTKEKVRIRMLVYETGNINSKITWARRTN